MEYEAMQDLLIFLSVLAAVLMIILVGVAITAFIAVKRFKKAISMAEHNLDRVLVINKVASTLKGPLFMTYFIKGLMKKGQT